jgi:hypothetical protein
VQNIEQVLKVLNTFSLESVFPNKSDEHHFVEVVLPKAQKEFEALKAAGVEVKIEQVEHIIVLKPKSKRGSYRPRTKKSE